MSILGVAIVPPHLVVRPLMRMAVAIYVTGISTPEVHLESPPLLGTLTMDESVRRLLRVGLSRRLICSRRHAVALLPGLPRRRPHSPWGRRLRWPATMRGPKSCGARRRQPRLGASGRAADATVRAGSEPSTQKVAATRG